MHFSFPALKTGFFGREIFRPILEVGRASKKNLEVTAAFGGRRRPFSRPGGSPVSMLRDGRKGKRIGKGYWRGFKDLQMVVIAVL